MTTLTETEIEATLRDLPGWSHAGNGLTRTFQFGSFREAMSFIFRVAFEAEALDHHPHLTNEYSTVAFTLRTHDAGNQVTAKDAELARAIQRIAWVD